MTELKERAKEILIVEDSVEDVDLTIEALKGAKVQYRLNVLCDGTEVLPYLRREGKYAKANRPHLIILDLRLPKKDGHSVLAEIKSEPAFKKIPVLILTTSQDKRDIEKSYELGASCYVVKPLNLDQLLLTMKWIEDWLTFVRLPDE